jgi:hypothetical protein
MLSSQSVARSMHPWSMTQGRAAGENLVNPGCLAVVVPVGECGSPSTVAAQLQRATILAAGNGDTICGLRGIRSINVRLACTTPGSPDTSFRSECRPAPRRGWL